MNEGWRIRLQAALDASGRSMRDVSIAAGFAHGYLHSVLRDGKEPGVSALLALCRELGVSGAHVILGFELSPSGEELLKLLRENPQAEAGILQILRAQAKA